jgi:integrase/recombinase XerD
VNFTAIPTIRKDKKDAKGFVPICIIVYSAGSKIRISLGHKINAAHWDEKERRVKKNVDEASLLNALIEKKLSELKTKVIAEQIFEKDKPIDISLVIKKERIRNICFYEFAEKQIVQKNYAEETRRAYRIYIEKLKDYKKTLRLTEIDFQFLQGYQAYLRDTLKNSHNTIWGNFKFINTMTNDALKMKLIVEDPFKTFKRLAYKQTQRTYLQANELNRIETFVNVTQDDGLRLVGKYFLFMAFTGLRFSDAIRFRSELHVVNDERIVIETQKTKKMTNIFINDKIKLLISFINERRLNLTQVDFNRKLKIIAAGASVDKKVSSHVARHSFGSSLADLGIPLEVAKGLLSHGSLSSTKIYYHIKEANLDEAMKKFNTVS